ncbi:hypothetical protein Efla_002724 [Eimeria flavescens]
MGSPRAAAAATEAFNRGWSLGSSRQQQRHSLLLLLLLLLVRSEGAPAGALPPGPLPRRPSSPDGEGETSDTLLPAHVGGPPLIELPFRVQESVFEAESASGIATKEVAIAAEATAAVAATAAATAAEAAAAAAGGPSSQPQVMYEVRFKVNVRPQSSGSDPIIPAEIEGVMSLYSPGGPQVGAPQEPPRETPSSTATFPLWSKMKESVARRQPPEGERKQRAAERLVQALAGGPFSSFHFLFTAAIASVSGVFKGETPGSKLDARNSDSSSRSSMSGNSSRADTLSSGLCSNDRSRKQQ